LLFFIYLPDLKFGKRVTKQKNFVSCYRYILKQYNLKYFQFTIIIKIVNFSWIFTHTYFERKLLYTVKVIKVFSKPRLQKIARLCTQSCKCNTDNYLLFH